MPNAALFPAKRLFAQVCDLAVDIQVLPLKIVQLRGQPENFCSHGFAYFERSGSRIVFHLANLICRALGVVPDAQFNVFRGTALEYAPESDLRRLGGRSGSRCGASLS